MPLTGPRYSLGFDAGSVAMKVVVTDESHRIVEWIYRRTHGQPLQTALVVFEEVQFRFPGEAFCVIAGTSSVGRPALWGGDSTAGVRVPTCGPFCVNAAGAAALTETLSCSVRRDSLGRVSRSLSSCLGKH